MADDPTSLEDLASALVAAKETMEAAKVALDEAKDAYARLEAQLLQAAADDQQPVRASGRYVSVHTTHRWSVPKDQKEAVLSLLKEHRPDLVKETVHPATLNKVAEQMRTSDAPEPWWADVGALLDMKATTAVKVTKAKPRKSD